MRKSTRQELRMLRGIVRSVLEGRLCYFCKEPLLQSRNHYGHGDGEGSKIREELTEHHKDGDHSNNEKTNRAWAHRSCHKSFHMGERHRARRLAKRK